jgi:hypothetical protein
MIACAVAPRSAQLPHSLLCKWLGRRGEWTHPCGTKRRPAEQGRELLSVRPSRPTGSARCCLDPAVSRGRCRNARSSRRVRAVGPCSSSAAVRMVLSRGGGQQRNSLPPIQRGAAVGVCALPPLHIDADTADKRCIGAGALFLHTPPLQNLVRYIDDRDEMGTVHGPVNRKRGAACVTRRGAKFGRAARSPLARHVSHRLCRHRCHETHCSVRRRPPRPATSPRRPSAQCQTPGSS